MGRAFGTPAEVLERGFQTRRASGAVLAPQHKRPLRDSQKSRRPELKSSGEGVVPDDEDVRKLIDCRAFLRALEET